jgi:hypothetical protein
MMPHCLEHTILPNQSEREDKIEIVNIFSMLTQGGETNSKIQDKNNVSSLTKMNYL